MKALTLKQTTKAIKDLRARHEGSQKFTDLVDAQGYMLGMVRHEPPDPRIFLTEIGYNW